MSRVSLEIVMPMDGADRVEAASPAALPRSVATSAGEHAIALSQLTPEGGLRGCLGCGHPELYTRKDFPRAVGIAVVVTAAVLAPFTAYVSLFAAALADAVLFKLAPEVVVCYRCGSRHRGFAPRPRHPRFDREIDERLKFGHKAVMGKPMRPGGTADAPDPEH